MMKNLVYPNAPLVEAVFEIRFPGEPSIECRRDEFYELIRDKYKIIYVPKLKPGQSPALQPYQFKQENHEASVMTAINSFAFSVKRYEGFNKFRPEAIRLLKLFCEKFKIKKLNRIGLRYINVIPYVREKNIVPLTDYLNISIKLPSAFSEHFKNFDLIFVSQTAGGLITTRIEQILKEDGTEEAILLDFDFYKEENLQSSQLEGYLDESHLQTKKMFEEIITDTYRNYIKGETI